MNVIFVNYGLFNSNSGGHVASFANALGRIGVRVLVVGTNDPQSVLDFGPPQFQTARVMDWTAPIPDAVLQLARAPDTLIHAWTPRRNVQRFVQEIEGKTGCPYFVHLEDNELHLLAASVGVDANRLSSMPAAQLDRLVPDSLAHPVYARWFMEHAAGVTVIVDRLKEFSPPELPVHVLEPGVDMATFGCDLSLEEKMRLRAELYIEPEATVIAYNGNMHPANWRDIFSLYTAMLILKRRGHKVVLIRTGEDYASGADVSYDYLRGDWVINLGVLERSRMAEVLKLADLFIQPGAPDAFNAYRLPSKVPEFLASGRPVLLPSTNIGLKLEDGYNAILLQRGDGTEIADRVEALLPRPDQLRQIGREGRRFASEHLNWERNAGALLTFYRHCLDWRRHCHTASQGTNHVA